MPDGNRLLVPIDGSDHSLRALAQAIKRVASDRQLADICTQRAIAIASRPVCYAVDDRGASQGKEQGGFGASAADAPSKSSESGDPGSGGRTGRNDCQSGATEALWRDRSGQPGVGKSQGAHLGFGDHQGHSCGACAGNRSAVGMLSGSSYCFEYVQALMTHSSVAAQNEI